MGQVATSSGDLEFVTVVKVDSYTGELDVLAAHVEQQIVRLIAEHGIAALRQYFVRALGTGIQIGFRFRGLRAEHVESTSTDLVREALQGALEAEGRGSQSGRITSTLFAGV